MFVVVARLVAVFAALLSAVAAYDWTLHLFDQPGLCENKNASQSRPTWAARGCGNLPCTQTGVSYLTTQYHLDDGAPANCTLRLYRDDSCQALLGAYDKSQSGQCLWTSSEGTVASYDVADCLPLSTA